MNTSGDGKNGLYVYCFARPDHVRQVHQPGVGNGNGVSTLIHNDVAVVFSEVPLAEFSAENMQDPSWLVPRAYQHEQVIEEVMSQSAVLPVRFGAVFSSRDALTSLVARKAEAISEFLTRVAGKAEWAVKGFADMGQAEAWLLRSDPALVQQQEALLVSPGVRYLRERRMRADVQNHLKLWRRTVAGQVQQELQEMAEDVRSLPLAAPDDSGEQEMVLNCAFLLLNHRSNNFRAEVRDVESWYAEQGLRLQVTGPWPPFNFCPDLSASPLAPAPERR